MTGSVVRWCCRLIPLWAVGCGVLLLLFPDGLYLWVRLNASVPEIVEEFSRESSRWRDAIAAGLMAIYGAYRVAGFHPCFRTDYRRWLELTPWNSRKSLPLGPIHLVWQDALLLGSLVLFLNGTPYGRLGAAAALLSGYLALLDFSFWITGPWWMVYVILFGLGLAIRLLASPPLALALLVVLCALSMAGLRWALARFPWQTSPAAEYVRRQFAVTAPDRQKPPLEWPYNRLVGVRPERVLPYRDGILLSLLAGWWLYAITSNLTAPHDRANVPPFLFGLVTLVACVTRLALYVVPCWPPISVWGRIRTGRWIIPGYDYVLIAPLCTLLVAAIASPAASLAGSAYNVITYSLATAIVLMIALNVGPSRRRWYLTGHHRFVAWGSSDPTRVRL